MCSRDCSTAMCWKWLIFSGSVEAEDAADAGLGVGVGDLAVGEQLHLLQLLLRRHPRQQVVDLLLDRAAGGLSRGCEGLFVVGPADADAGGEGTSCYCETEYECGADRPRPSSDPCHGGSRELSMWSPRPRWCWQRGDEHRVPTCVESMRRSLQPRRARACPAARPDPEPRSGAHDHERASEHRAKMATWTGRDPRTPPASAQPGATRKPAGPRRSAGRGRCLTSS